MILTFLYGLPACGKTTYAKGQKKPGVCCVMDVDRIARARQGDALVREASEVAAANLGRFRRVILDGLFTTNEPVRAILAAVRRYVPTAQCEIVRWEPDRESCQHNDRGRRHASSPDIALLPFEEPDVPGATVVRLDVQRKPDYKVWAAEAGLGEALESGSWCVGGEWGNCWGQRGTVSVAPQPNFDEFDGFLERLCPQVSFLQYKKLYAACVRVEEWRECGHYGSHWDRRKYVCDLAVLHRELLALGLL